MRRATVCCVGRWSARSRPRRWMRRGWDASWASSPPGRSGSANSGRWIGYMRRGRFSHEDLAGEPPLPHEEQLGAIAHCVIGMGLTVGYLSLLRLRHAEPRVSTALAYGSATTVLPWLIVQPAHGLGWFGLRSDQPGAVIRTNLLGHAIFGLGIGVWALALASRSDVTLAAPLDHRRLLGRSRRQSASGRVPR
jgi:hypothetical protein